MKFLNELIFRKNCLTNSIVVEKRRLHKEFVRDNRWLFWVFDIALVFMLLFNIGSLVLTNVMVVKVDADQGITTEFVELNPVASEVHDFVPAVGEDRLKWLGLFLKQSIFWFILFFCYLYYRLTIFCWAQVWWILFFVVYGLVLMSRDFSNNFGFFLGTKLFGVT